MRIRLSTPKKIHMNSAHLEDFHESRDIELGVKGKVVDVSDEVNDLLLEEMEVFFDIFQCMFVAVDNHSVVVVVVRTFIRIVSVRFLCLGIVGSTTRRAVRVV